MSTQTQLKPGMIDEGRICGRRGTANDTGLDKRQQPKKASPTTRDDLLLDVLARLCDRPSMCVRLQSRG